MSKPSRYGGFNLRLRRKLKVTTFDLGVAPKSLTITRFMIRYRNDMMEESDAPSRDASRVAMGCGVGGGSRQPLAGAWAVRWDEAGTVAAWARGLDGERPPTQAC